MAILMELSVLSESFIKKQNYLKNLSLTINEMFKHYGSENLKDNKK